MRPGPILLLTLLFAASARAERPNVFPPIIIDTSKITDVPTDPAKAREELPKMKEAIVRMSSNIAELEEVYYADMGGKSYLRDQIMSLKLNLAMLEARRDATRIVAGDKDPALDELKQKLKDKIRKEKIKKTDADGRVKPEVEEGKEDSAGEDEDAAARGAGNAEAEAAAARAAASVDRARAAGGGATRALGGAESWNDGKDAEADSAGGGGSGSPRGGGSHRNARTGDLKKGGFNSKGFGGGGSGAGAGGAGGGGGGPGGLGEDKELTRAMQGGYKDSLASFGYKLGIGADSRPAIVRADGSAVSASELAGLSAALSAEPRALVRRPDFFTVLPREKFALLKKSHAAAPERKGFRHVGMSREKTDFQWTESCSRVSGGCNEYSRAGSYRRDDYVDPETLSDIARLMKELEAPDAEDAAGAPPPETRGPKSLDDILAGMNKGGRPSETAAVATGGAGPGGLFRSAKNFVFGERPAASKPGDPPRVGRGPEERVRDWALWAVLAAALAVALRVAFGSRTPDPGPE